MIKGKVWLVGAGPGDPSLLTIGGANALKQADVIIYDALANSYLLRYANNNAKLVYVGKIADQHTLPQEEINNLLAEYALQGLKVVRLKGGDPYIFGRGGEEAEHLAALDIPFEEVPGISSAIAAPAYAGIPLTHRDLVSSLTIITGHERGGKEKSSHNWEAFVKSNSTLVFLMGMRNLPDICQNLIMAGMKPDMPAAVIYKGTTPMQKTVTAPLQNLAEKAAASGLTNPAVIVVGKVVNLREQMDWFEKKPLLGKTIVVTRAREQASDIALKLELLGARVIECPTIKIQPLKNYDKIDSSIHHLHEYRWLIFTSVNGVKYFWERLVHANRDARALHGCKVAAIGPATAQALEERGIRPDFLPDSFVAESIAEGLVKREGKELKDAKILIPRALQARTILPELLHKAGAKVTVEAVYETVPEENCAQEIKELLACDEVDCITFASSSTVENFLKLIPDHELKKHTSTILAVIGPITKQTLKKHDLSCTITSSTYTIPALIDAIVNYYTG